MKEELKLNAYCPNSYVEQYQMFTKHLSGYYGTLESSSSIKLKEKCYVKILLFVVIIFAINQTIISF